MDMTEPTYSFSEARQKLLRHVEKGQDRKVAVAEAVELCLEEALSTLDEAVHDAARKVFGTYSKEAFALIVDIFEKQNTPKH